MSERGFVGLSPARVTAAADHLRDRVRQADLLEADIRRAATLARMAPFDVVRNVAEIEEELGVLATLLTVRASEAAGFRMPGSGWDFESDLLASLLDDDGHRATVTGPLAIALVRHHRLGVVDGASPTISIERLRTIADDPTTDPELAAAAAFLAANPLVVADATPLGIGGEFGFASADPGQIPLADLDLFLTRNDLLAATFARIDPSDGWSDLTDLDLRRLGVEPSAFDAALLPRSTHDLVVAAINHGTFNHSPDTARSFLASLPVQDEDGFGLAFGAVGPWAVTRLADAAVRDLPSPGDPQSSDEDLIARLHAIAHLPETRAGTRNALITQAYADIAVQLGAPINGGLQPLDPDFRGHNWFHLGVVASDSVGPVISDDQTVYGFPISEAVRAEIANGNQAIFAHFTAELTRHLRGEPVSTPTMQRAFTLLDEAASTDDTSEAQHLMAESSILFALVEQEIVDPFLQLDALRAHERLGTHALSFFGGDHRTAEEVMTDMGQMQFLINGGEIRPAIEIGAPVPTTSQSNNLVDPQAVFAQLPGDIDWNLAVAEDWSVYGERMPIIGQVAIASLTDPALTAVTDDRRSHS